MKVLNMDPYRESVFYTSMFELQWANIFGYQYASALYNYLHLA